MAVPIPLGIFFRALSSAVMALALSRISVHSRASISDISASSGKSCCAFARAVSVSFSFSAKNRSVAVSSPSVISLYEAGNQG